MARKGYRKRGAKARSIRQRRYNGTRLQKRRRAMRNKARRKGIKSGRVRKGDGKDIDHLNRRSLRGRTQVISIRRNRAKNKPLWRKRRRKRRR